MQNLGGQTKSIMVFSKMAYSKRVGHEVPGVMASLKFVFKRLSVYVRRPKQKQPLVNRRLSSVGNTKDLRP